MKHTKLLKISYVILGIVVITGALFVVELKRREEIFYEQSLEKEYSRALNSASKHVIDIEESLEKLRLVTDSNQNAELFAIIWRTTALARRELSSLPESVRDMGEFMWYMNQVGEFSYTMMGKLQKGGELSVDDQRLASEYKEGCCEINSILSKAVARNNSGIEFSNSIEWKNLSTFIKADINAVTFEPGGRLEIPLEEGVEIVKHFLEGHDITDIVYRGATDRDILEGIPVHSYDIYIGNSMKPTVWIDLSRDAGYPVMMTKEPKSFQTGEVITTKEAIKIGDKFLKHIGFSDMNEAGYKINNNIATITYIPITNKTAVYTDAVKLKISLSDGEIMGFHAVGYLKFHHTREQLRPKLSQDEILELISDQVRVNEIRMAIVEPEDSPGQEAYCYEITGSLEDKEYKIFINANNGRREKIVKL